MESKIPKTVIFITGAFASHRTWDKWISYYEERGYNCIAPAWPNKNASSQILKSKHPDNNIADTKLSNVLKHYTEIISQQPMKPIVIGHSLGGLIVQLLLQQNLVIAGVALHPIPPKGIFSLNPTCLLSSLKRIGLFSSSNEPHLINFKEWQSLFTNGTPYEEQKYSHGKDVVPQSKRVLKDRFSQTAKINFTTPHEPLLIVSGTTDRITLPSINYKNYTKYDKKNSSVIDYKEFQNKNHFSYGLSSWKEEADYILDWLEIIDC
ncbi:MAG: alpha/beta hydrolase [Flavobacterium sp. MedPE-SWcel]|uniref:alpha/beta hydrolase n=1 Tax=uncultured Flavobacterium sp. TaxID=165435 RepID=UPI0009240C41|nr:alpha/beta fold hydrolase [uncultured Flavobacterium sp.]OIQ20175.1 MAG: alpha/beta hydrolase [Flavobacterium sp. MedPE-SWcel]